MLDKVADSVQNDAHRREVFDMGKTMAEHLKEEGRQEEKVRSSRSFLVRLLRNKFGKLPTALVKRIEATERLELLQTWFDEASSAKKIEDVSFAAE